MSLDTFPSFAVLPNVNVTPIKASGAAPLLMASVSKLVLVTAAIAPGPANALPSEVPPITVETIRCRWVPWLKLLAVLVQCT